MRATSMRATAANFGGYVSFHFFLNRVLACVQPISGKMRFAAIVLFCFLAVSAVLAQPVGGAREGTKLSNIKVRQWSLSLSLSDIDSHDDSLMCR